MNQPEIEEALRNWRDAKAEGVTTIKRHRSDLEYVLTRLVYEAAANYMSAEQVGECSGMTTAAVRTKMRAMGMDTRRGKALLAQSAAEALQENAALLGIEPHEMDLTSPLAYLPMGYGTKKFLETEAMRGVKEIPEEEIYEELADTVYDVFPWEGQTYEAVADKIAQTLVDNGWRKVETEDTEDGS